MALKYLDLPYDIHAAIFKHLGYIGSAERRGTIRALRLTCKQLSSLLKPSIFSDLTLKIERPNDVLVNLLQDILDIDIGPQVRHLILDLRLKAVVPTWGEVPLAEGERQGVLADILRTMSNVREIIVHTADNVEFPILVETLKSFQSVEHLTVIETLSNTHWQRSKQGFISPFIDPLVRTVLESSGSKLLSLTVDGESVMSMETFEALRDNATCLQTLLLQSFIGKDLRESFCEPQLWACSDTLEHLGLYNCRGAHSGGIVSGIANGFISTVLRSLDVVMCGTASDSPCLPYPIKAQTPVLEKLWIEHALQWEAIFLGHLGAKHVVLTHAPRTIALELIKGPYLRGIRSLNVVKVREEMRDDTAVVEACKERSIKLSMDAVAWRACSCDLRE